VFYIIPLNTYIVTLTKWVYNLTISMVFIRPSVGLLWYIQ